MKKILGVIICCTAIFEADARLSFESYLRFMNSAFPEKFDNDSDLTRGFIVLNEGTLDAQRIYGNVRFEVPRTAGPTICSKFDTSNDPTTDLLIVTHPSAGDAGLSPLGAGSIDYMFPQKRLEIIAGMFNIANEVRRNKFRTEECEVLKIIRSIDDLKSKKDLSVEEFRKLRDEYFQFSEKYFSIDNSDSGVHLDEDTKRRLIADTSGQAKSFEEKIRHLNKQKAEICKLWNELNNINMLDDELKAMGQSPEKNNHARERLLALKIVDGRRDIKDYVGVIPREKGKRLQNLKKLLMKNDCTQEGINNRINDLDRDIADLERIHTGLLHAQQILNDSGDLIQFENALIESGLKSLSSKTRDVMMRAQYLEKFHILFRLGRDISQSVFQEREEGDNATDSRVQSERPYFHGFTNDIICAYACGVLSDEDNLETLASLIKDKGEIDNKLMLYWDNYLKDGVNHFPFAPGSSPISNSCAKYKNLEFADCVETTLRHLLIALFSNRFGGNVAIDRERIPETKIDEDLILNLKSLTENQEYVVPETLRDFFTKKDVSYLVNDDSLQTRSVWAAFCGEQPGVEYNDQVALCNTKSEWKNLIRLFCSVMREYPELVKDANNERVQRAAKRISDINNDRIKIEFGNILEILNDLLGIRTDLTLVAEKTNDIDQLTGHIMPTDYLQETPLGIFGAITIRPEKDHLKCEELVFVSRNKHAFLNQISQSEKKITDLTSPLILLEHGRYINPNILKDYPIMQLYRSVREKFDILNAEVLDIIKSEKYPQYSQGIERLLRSKILSPRRIFSHIKDIEVNNQNAKFLDKNIALFIDNVSNSAKSFFDLFNFFSVSTIDDIYNLSKKLRDNGGIEVHRSLAKIVFNHDGLPMIPAFWSQDKFRDLIEICPPNSINISHAMILLPVYPKLFDCVFRKIDLNSDASLNNFLSIAASTGNLDKVVSKYGKRLNNIPIFAVSSTLPFISDTKLIEFIIRAAEINQGTSVEDIHTVISAIPSEQCKLLLEKYSGDFLISDVVKLSEILPLRSLINRTCFYGSTFSSIEDEKYFYELMKKCSKEKISVSELLEIKPLKGRRIPLGIAGVLTEFAADKNEIYEILKRVDFGTESIDILLYEYNPNSIGPRNKKRRNSALMSELLIELYPKYFYNLSIMNEHILDCLSTDESIRAFLKGIKFDENCTLYNLDTMLRHQNFNEIFEVARELYPDLYLPFMSTYKILKSRVVNESVKNWIQQIFWNDESKAFAEIEKFSASWLVFVREIFSFPIMEERIKNKVRDFIVDYHHEKNPKKLTEGTISMISCAIDDMTEEYNSIIEEMLEDLIMKRNTGIMGMYEKLSLAEIAIISRNPKMMKLMLRYLKRRAIEEKTPREEKEFKRVCFDFFNGVVPEAPEEGVSELVELLWEMDKSIILQRIDRGHILETSLYLEKVANGLVTSKIEKFDLDDASALIEFISKNYLEDFVKNRINFPNETIEEIYKKLTSRCNILKLNSIAASSVLSLNNAIDVHKERRELIYKYLVEGAN